MSMSSEQISLVRLEVIRNSVTSPSLQDDLIDHLCCEIEVKMHAGKDFEQSLKESVEDLAPNGLQQIQRETNFLLHSKKIHMKKITFLFGLISAMTMSLGLFLRTLRIVIFSNNPGETGNAIFAFGALGFVVVFLPMLCIDYFRNNAHRSWREKLQVTLGVWSIIFIGLAMLAYIMHLPGADEVMLIGGILFTFGFLPFLFFSFYKKSAIKHEH